MVNKFFTKKSFCKIYQQCQKGQFYGFLHRSQHLLCSYQKSAIQDICCQIYMILVYLFMASLLVRIRWEIYLRCRRWVGTFCRRFRLRPRRILWNVPRRWLSENRPFHIISSHSQSHLVIKYIIYVCCALCYKSDLGFRHCKARSHLKSFVRNPENSGEIRYRNDDQSAIL